jgi:hypothetical protein
MKRIWAIVIILVLIMLGVIGYFIWRANKQNPTSSASPTPSASVSASTEVWTKSATKLMDNVTSTCTRKLTDGTYRMYLARDGKIVYANSKDAKTFETTLETGINAEANKFISNPAVLQISDSNWIMIYEEAPLLPAGSVKGPGRATQRNLLLATSTDGQNFVKVGIAIDSAKDDKYFASVPDLVKIRDDFFRLYYVSQGDKIASAVSSDGKTWKREPDFRLVDSSVDPNVLFDETKWIMYFATLEGTGNKFYRATSKDGFTWEKGQIVLRPKEIQGAIVDPDVVNVSDSKYRMFFGESADGNAQMNGGGQFNLYYADTEANIFQ